MLKNIFIVISIIFLFGCGDNSTLSLATPPSQQLKGTYKLVSASGNYTHQNGVISLDAANSITGTLVLGEVSYDETLVIDGVTYSRGNGSYIMTFPTGTVEGSMAMTYPDGGSSYNVKFNGLNLALTGNHTITWQKVND